jgi:hypothetical protein
MKATFEEKDDVIIRRFSGEVTIEDMLDSWKELFKRYEDLSRYKGIITTFDDVMLKKEKGGGVKAMVNILNENKDKLKGVRVAIVLDHPAITNAVMVGHYVKDIKVQPFVTVEAAMSWISP